MCNTSDSNRYTDTIIDSALKTSDGLARAAFKWSQFLCFMLRNKLPTYTAGQELTLYIVSKIVHLLCLIVLFYTFLYKVVVVPCMETMVHSQAPTTQEPIPTLLTVSGTS